MPHPYKWDDSVVDPVLIALEKRIAKLRAQALDRTALDSVRAWYRIHHTYNSNAIEGNTLSHVETRVVVEDGLTIGGKPLKDHLEAVNLAHALDLVDRLSINAERPTERTIRELHAVVLRGIDFEPGLYRTVTIRVSGSGQSFPNPAKVPEKMAELSAWLEAGETVSPVIRSAIAHAWLVTVHPFVDGNGRTARLLGNLVLMKDQYPPALVQLEDRARYFAALESSHSKDLTDFILVVAEWVERTLSEYERTVAPVAREPVASYLGIAVQ